MKQGFLSSGCVYCCKSYGGPEEEVSILISLSGRQGLSSHWTLCLVGSQ